MRLKWLPLFFLLLAIPAFAQKANEPALGPQGFLDVSSESAKQTYDALAAAMPPAAIITQMGITDYLCTAFPGNPPLGKIRFYCDSGTNKLVCIDSTGANACPGGGGGGGSPGGGNGALQCNVSSSFGACNASDLGAVFTVNEPQINLLGNLSITGPNPYVDVTTYGVRSMNPAVAPAVPGITATTINGQNTVALSSASSFKNLDGVVIYGGGPPHSMATPGAPTVTPSIAKAALGTPLFVVNSPAAATTYNYKVVARDTAGGLTAASSVGTTTTGVASLGAITSALTSCSQAAGGNTVACITPSSHGLSVGSMIHVGSTTNDQQFAGWYNVATVPDTTHFTYSTGQWNFTLAAITSTGGQAQYFTANHVSWSAVTGAWEYYICSDRASPGNYAVVGVSRPESPFVPSDRTFDDYGSPMMDGIRLPPYVTSSICSAGTPTNDNLTTTITAGAGTTTLTLASLAGSSVTGTILYDAGAAFKVAATANNFGAPLFFPSGGTYVFNSICDVSGLTINVMVGGSLYLNETLKTSHQSQWYGDRLPSAISKTSFQWPGTGAITVNSANPGIFVPSLNSMGFSGLSFNQTANAAVSMIGDDGNAVIFDTLSFSTVQGSSDYMGIGLMLRGQENGTNNVFGYVMNRMTFVAQLGQTSAAPLFYCQACGAGRMTDYQFSGRGMAFSGQSTSGAGPFTLENLHIQAGSTPLIMNSAPSAGGFGAGSFLLKNVTLDTMANPMFTSFGNALFASVKITLSGTPAAGVPNFSGTPLAQIVADTFGNTSGQNFKVSITSGTGSTVAEAPINGPNLVDGPGFQVAGTLEMGYALSRPAAPTIVLGGSGSCVSNCVPAGTYFYAIEANDANQGYSLLSPPSASVTTDGTQTITPSWTFVNGQASTNRCRGTSVGGIICHDIMGSGASGTSYIDNGSTSYSVSTNGITTGNAEGIGSQGYAGHQAILVDPTSGFTSTEVPGTLTANRTVTRQDASGVLALLSGSFNNADCLQASKIGSVVFIVDNGSPCGTGGGGGATFQVNGTNTSVQTLINFQSATAFNGLTVAFSNPSAGNVTLGLSGTATKALLPATTVYTDQTNTFGAFLNDFSASTIKIPTAALCTATASSMLCYDSTNKNEHIWTNGADAINGAFPTIPASGDVVSVTVNSGAVTLTDSGTLAANLVSAAANFTNGDLIQAGGNNKTTSDAGIIAANVVTQTSNAAANQICAYTGTNKVCVPTTTLPTAAVPAFVGDATNSAGSLSLTVSKINNATVPASALAIGTNSSRQPVASSLQGTDISLLTSGTVAGTGITLCTDANGGATTSGCTSAGFANPMTTLGDLIYENATPVAARLAGPTTPNGITEWLTSTPSGGVAAAPSWAIPGVPIDAQTGTSYTVPITDDVHLLTLSNSSPVAVTGFALANNYVFAVKNLGAGLVTYTPASGLVNGNATQIIPQNWFGFHYTDNTNTFMPIMPTVQAFPACTNALQFTTATGVISCGTVPLGAGVSGILPFANGGLGTGTNFSAHQFFGNNTGSTATPAPALIGTSDVTPNIYVAAAGSVNVLTATLSPAATALVAGLEVDFLPNNANTTSTPSLNVNGLGAKTITKFGTNALANNDLTTTAVARVIYDGTEWQLLNPQTANGGGGSQTFDSTGSGLLAPVGNGSFTYPVGATTGFTLSGTAPASVSTSTGTNAMAVLTINGVIGGADSNATGTAGIGSSPSITAGSGGAGTGTNAVGGAGGAATLVAGNGGASNGTGANSNGGNVVLTPGSAGTGGSGTAGLAGVVSITGGLTEHFFALSQGSAVTTSNTNIPANSIIFQAPTSVTAYARTWASAAATGIPHYANSSSVVTETIGAVNLANSDVTGVLPFANISQSFVTNAQTSTYQVLAADFTGCKTIPVASGTFTITLVASGSQPANGQCIWVVNYGSGVVSIARSGQNINGGTASLTLAAGSATAPTGAFVFSDGTNYEAQVFGSGTGSATAFPLTVSGTVTSGGIPCFNSTTNEQTSGLLTQYGVVYGGGAGACPTVASPSTTITNAFFATATSPAFRNIGTSDTSVFWYAAGGGTAQAQTATLSPALTALTAGAEVHFLPTAANSGAGPTLAVNGLTATTITKYGAAALAANDLTSTAVADVIYDGTEWQLLNPQTNNGTVTSVGFTGGLISVATASTTPALTVAGTSGGIVCFTSTSAWASSALLGANQVLLGGGSGTCPTVAAADTTTTHAFFATAGAPAFRAIVAGDLPNIPINQVISATGAIATLANGNNPLVINCALTSGTTCGTFGETTAATTAGAVELQVATLSTSTAIPFQITQGAGVSATNAPLALNVAGGTGGANGGATNPGKKGGGITLATGAGSNAGATSGTGGAGGDFSFTAGNGGTAAVGSTTGAGGNIILTPGTAGGTGTSGAQGQVQVPCATVGAALTTPCLNITETWNTTGVVDAAIFLNVTNSASGTGSKLEDLQVGGSSVFNVAVSGASSINCTLATATNCLSAAEAVAATTAGSVEAQITTLTTSQAIGLQITQGAAGPANTAAPNLINISAAAAGGASSASNAGSAGAAIGLLTGAGSAGGATTGNGGAGGAFTMTEGAGGNAGGTATNNGGNGGGLAWTTGAGGNGGTGAATAGSGGGVTFTLGAPGTNSSTGTAGAVGQFKVTGNAPASTANTAGVPAGTIFNLLGVAGGASSNAAGTAGIGSVVSLNSGIGGAGTGTNAVGGAGGAVNLTAGAGGASLGTGANANGGSIVLTPGAAGTGGSGTAGLAGVVSVAGTTAGFVGFTQGSTNTTANTNIPANTIIEQAPTSVTAYTVTKPGAAPNVVSYEVTDACASSICTDSYKPAPTLLVVSSDFTTAANTNLQTITGLSYTMPASKAVVASFHCSLNWSQATGTAAVAFGIQGATTAPTSIDANATSYSNTTAETTGTLNGLNSTTATAIVSVAPSAITTIWKAEMDGTISAPSNASPTVVNWMVSTATSGDAVTVKKGSYCSVVFQ